MTQLVWAVKYTLPRQNGKYDPKSQGRVSHGGKVLSRLFVEQRNAVHDNNEYYEIDEEKSLELEKKRQEQVILNAEKRERKKMNQGDLAEILVNKLAQGTAKASNPVVGQPNPVVKSDSPDDSWSRAELQEYCNDNDVHFAKNWNKAALLEAITNHKPESDEV